MQSGRRTLHVETARFGAVFLDTLCEEGCAVRHCTVSDRTHFLILYDSTVNFKIDAPNL
jgi:hypothetical protein